ncbi:MULTISPECIES: hypothetical protein [Ralstonia]|uniref:hypothetical protein n=1 Tax=Ralstonia TaxID=48736 RepID=UPI000386EC2C|nr:MULTISPECIES: hypothetical protein [Ralstonia]EPX95224.1 hypothetical protein C404_22845 [Ralstonia sp. AU12-08]
MAPSDQPQTDLLTSLQEPQNLEQVFRNLRDISRLLARDVDRLGDELPQSEQQLRLAGELVARAQSDIHALQQSAKRLGDIWEHSESLAKVVGATAAKASTETVNKAVAELNTKLTTSVNAANDAANNLRSAMRMSKAPWVIAIFLSFALAMIAAFLTYKLTKPGPLAEKDIQRMQWGILLERMYQKASPKERAVLDKLTTSG